MHNLETLLEQSEELPSLPEIYTRVSELIESENSTARQIGEAVQTDASLTSRILKMINSAYYGLPNEVTSIAQAISYLGHQELKQILLGSVLAGVFDDLKTTSFPLLDFWHHSIKTAIIARHLAMQNINIIDHEAFFTAGLLHDIGRLVIANAAPETLENIDHIVATTGVDILQVEADQLGLTHIDVGAALMKKWGMPSLLIQCVKRHHEVNHIGPFAIDTSIVYLANQLSKQEPVVDDEDEEMKEMQEILSKIPNWQKAACTLEQINIACQLAEEQAFSVMESLGMNDMQIEDDYY